MSHESRELALFAINDGGLYRQRILPIIANLQKKISKGTYDPVLALKLWKYAADDAAQRYTKEFDAGRGYGIFTPTMRRDTAKELQDYYEEALRETVKNPKRRNPRTSLLADHARAIAPKIYIDELPQSTGKTLYGARVGGYVVAHGYKTKAAARHDAKAFALKNPARRKVKTGAIASPERIALQLQFQGQWLTVKYFPVSEAGNKAAKKLAQEMHRKKGFPMRAITAAV